MHKGATILVVGCRRTEAAASLLSDLHARGMLRADVRSFGMPHEMMLGLPRTAAPIMAYSASGLAQTMTPMNIASSHHCVYTPAFVPAMMPAAHVLPHAATRVTAAAVAALPPPPKPVPAAPPQSIHDAVTSLLTLPQASSSISIHNSSAPSAAATAAAAAEEVETSSVDEARSWADTETARSSPVTTHTALKTSQAKHNDSERRRVQKLKNAYVELSGVIRSRPDLVGVIAQEAQATEASPTRKRRRGDRNGAEGAHGAARSVPSHLSVLEDSASAMKTLFGLVDELKKENERLRGQSAGSA